MAVASGRDVLTVAGESFALTLYTHWHLEQRRRLDAIRRRYERFDMAGLMASAQHQPKEISAAFASFLESLTPLPPTPLPSAAEQTRARQLAVIRAAHAAVDVQTVPLS